MRKFIAAFVAALTILVVTPTPAQAAPQTVADLTWGSTPLDPVLVAQLNEAAVTETEDKPIATLIKYLVEGIAIGVQGIVRGTVVIVGTGVYVSLAFTGGVIATAGGFLPGPVGTWLVNVGDATIELANDIAQIIHVGPYGTATV